MVQIEPLKSQMDRVQAKWLYKGSHSQQEPALEWESMLVARDNNLRRVRLHLVEALRNLTSNSIWIRAQLSLS